MSRRVFLDVGANTGQSLAAVLDMGFDWIVCFEPVEMCWPSLKRISSRRPFVTIHKHGLWDKDVKQVVYDPGAKGAGLWVKDKREKSKLAGKPISEEVCEFRKASDWFRKNLKDSDIVFLKLNVEGAECDILDDLLDSGEFGKVAYVMVDFDSRKVSELRHREAATRARLAAYSAPRVLYCKDVMIGPTHGHRIRNWLRATGGVSSLNCG